MFKPFTVSGKSTRDSFNRVDCSTIAYTSIFGDSECTLTYSMRNSSRWKGNPFLSMHFSSEIDAGPSLFYPLYVIDLSDVELE